MSDLSRSLQCRAMLISRTGDNQLTKNIRNDAIEDNHHLSHLHLSSQIYTTLLETFKLQDGPQGKIRERIFGAKACRADEKPKDESIVTSHKPHSHTQKFLAKIMGKASSMESLSPTKQEPKQSGMARHKPMSQSTSDIFRYDFRPVCQRVLYMARVENFIKRHSMNSQNIMKCSWNFSSLRIELVGHQMP